MDGDECTAMAARSDEPQWYALHTRAKHERAVAVQLLSKGVQSFVPSIRQIHRWSDRSTTVDVPLFSCYVFVHDFFARVHLPVLRTPGVLRWVGTNGQPVAIPDSQIEAVRSLLEKNAPLWPHAFLPVGQRVRIRGGCLNGIEGTVVEHKGGCKLILSIDLIQQSVATTIDGYDVEPV